MSPRRPALAAALAVAVSVGGSLASAGRAAAAPPRWQTMPPPPAMPAPAAHGDAPVDDVTLHWAAYGEATAPPVVLLHGGLGSGDDFAAQVGPLAAHFRVLVVDARGHGRSPRSRRGVSYHRMAEDLVAVLDQLQLDRVALVGWSDGGVIALDVALHHPARVSRLVITGTNFDRRGLRPPAKHATFTAYYARCVREYARLSPAPDQLGAFRRELRAMWKAEPAYTAAQLATITAPLLVLHAEHDELIRRAHVERLVALVPGATLTVLPDVSHFAMWQDPEGFNAAVLAFLRPAPP